MHKMLKIVEKTKIWFAISLIIIIIGVSLMAFRGLKFGIDFKGGTDIVIDMESSSFQKEDVEKIIKKYASDETSNVVNKTQIEVKSAEISNDNIKKMFQEIKDKYKLKASSVASQDNIGISYGNQMKRNAIIAVIIANIIILGYIAVRFEFKFGIAAIVALIHDVLITLTYYAIFRNPIDSAFVAAILTVLGYSMSDTIVVFDRIRENQKYLRKTGVTELADMSITQTLRRSINTVLTVIITLVSVFIFVPAVRSFTEPLLVGIISGCYSSIFIATPVWVLLKKHSDRRKEKKKQASLQGAN